MSLFKNVHPKINSSRLTWEHDQIISRQPFLCQTSPLHVHFARELLEKQLFLHIQRQRITVHHCTLCCVSYWYLPLYPESSIMPFSLKNQYVVKCHFLFVVGQFLCPFYWRLKKQEWSSSGRRVQCAGCAEALFKSRMLKEEGHGSDLICVRHLSSFTEFKEFSVDQMVPSK